jgi:hypothetical protein
MSAAVSSRQVGGSQPLQRSPPPRLRISWMAGFDAIDSQPLAPTPQAAKQGLRCIRLMRFDAR